MIRQAPGQYDPRFMQELLNDIAKMKRETYQKRVNIDLDPDSYIIMTSPNGTRYSVTVSNAGALVVTSL